MIQIIWFFAFMSATAPVTGKVTELGQEFATRAECEAYGEQNRERAVAFIRNAFDLKPHVEVQIAFQCMNGGQDA